MFECHTLNDEKKNIILERGNDVGNSKILLQKKKNPPGN